MEISLKTSTRTLKHFQRTWQQFSRFILSCTYQNVNLQAIALFSSLSHFQQVSNMVSRKPLLHECSRNSPPLPHTWLGKHKIRNTLNFGALFHPIIFISKCLSRLTFINNDPFKTVLKPWVISQSISPGFPNQGRFKACVFSTRHIA